MTSKDEWYSSVDAAEIAGVTKETMLLWCKKYGIGHKVAGRWRVSTEKLYRFLKGVDGEEDKKG